MRLDEIAEEYGDQVEVVWRSFLLRPQPEDRTVEKFAAYTKSWERPGSLEPKVTFNPWPLDVEPPSHSVPSAVAGKVAGQFGPAAYQQFHHRVMRAYFSENRTISDRSVLLDLAAESGMDRDAFDERWKAGAADLLNEVVTEHTEAINAGITAVPSLVVGEKYLVAGAVEVDDYRQVIERFRSDLAAD